MSDDKPPISLAADNPDHKPKPWARRSARDPEQIICDCGASLWMRAESAPMLQNLKVKKGAPALVCVPCLAKGKVSVKHLL